jgi:NAD(P)-dependent dehydrogenase (short-subunit alcohol dehydrogenase family)
MTNERVALVVGAGIPLGEATAMELGRAGLRVALNDLLPTRIDASAAAINAAGGQAAGYAVDLTRKLALQTMLQDILEKWGRIDVLVFIASVQPATPLLDLDEWDWHRALDANLTAAFLCMQSVGRTMRTLGSGTIVNIIAASEVSSAVFAAASAGLVALSEAARAEYKAAGIQVHALHNPSAADVTALTQTA